MHDSDCNTGAWTTPGIFACIPLGSDSFWASHQAVVALAEALQKNQHSRHFIIGFWSSIVDFTPRSGNIVNRDPFLRELEARQNMQDVEIQGSPEPRLRSLSIYIRSPSAHFDALVEAIPSFQIDELVLGPPHAPLSVVRMRLSENWSYYCPLRKVHLQGLQLDKYLCQGSRVPPRRGVAPSCRLSRKEVC